MYIYISLSNVLIVYRYSFLLLEFLASESRCADCEDIFPMTEAIKYGRKWKCKPCHSSYRWCRDHDPAFSTYNAEQRKKTIVANRQDSQRGVARTLVATHQDDGTVLNFC